MSQDFKLFDYELISLFKDIQLFSNGVINYSKDQFWWHGDEIDYDGKDQFSGQPIEIIVPF